jgi:hypothetical protein
VQKVLGEHFGLYKNKGTNVIVDIQYLADSVDPVKRNNEDISPFSFILDVLNLSENCIDELSHIEQT